MEPWRVVTRIAGEGERSQVDESDLRRRGEILSRGKLSEVERDD